MKDLSVLLYPLPEDVQQARTFGDYPRALRLIERRLNMPETPACMKQRLELEKQILQRLPAYYPYTEEEAYALVKKEIPDFTMEELREWEDSRKADWIYVNGQVHLQDRFFDSVKKVYADIAARAHADADDRSHLDENVRMMKENGEAMWHVHMRTSVKIADDAFHPGHARVWLPVPIAAQNMKNIRILKAEPAFLQESSAACGSHTVYFEEDLQENRWFSVEYEYDSYVRYTRIDPAAVTSACSETPQMKLPQITATPYLLALCDELKKDETNPAVIARRIYDFCTKNVTYAFMREYMTLGQIPEYCAAGLKGDCGVQALLFITLCCLAGIPAKWQSGLYVTPDDAGNHDWAMFYLEPYGWLFADPSFGGSAYRSGNMERHDYYFGNLDPFRMAANRDVQCEFEPAEGGLRYDPYDSQGGEIELDGEMLGRGRKERRYEVLEMKKVL